MTLSIKLVAALLALLIGISSLMVRAADGPTEEVVKEVIEKPFLKPSSLSVKVKFIWRSIKIGSPRKASSGETRAAGLPPSVSIYPVLVDYTRIIGDGGRDYQWHYYFYKDDFGTWAMQSNATTGNLGSDLYYVKP